MSVTGTRGSEMPYAFGDSEIAARRLELLSRVFADSTRAYLRRSVSGRPGLTIDLGCGPGYSTHFLAHVLQSHRVVGIDNSEPFIALAQSRAAEGVAFALHDFTTVPFPEGPADLLYARFELSHIKEPQAIVQSWGTQLRPGGLLLLEETEWIRTSNSAFAIYLEIVEAMLRSQSTRLYVGRELDALQDTEGLRRRASDLGRPRVPSSDAARMFYLNILTWKRHPFVQAHYSPTVIQQLEDDLESLTRRPGDADEIEWGLRQLVFERVE